MPLPSLYSSADKKGREWSVARAAGIGAALGFAVLCSLIAALRNFIASRLIWPKL